MKQYLFLFPVDWYFNNIIENKRFYGNRDNIGELFDIIDARYRNNGYKISWLLFSSEEGEPNLTSIPPYVRIKKDDNIVNAGISPEECVREYRYADPEHVLDQMPEHERLVLGGFHMYSCVNRIAKASHERGVDTFVDEDTTDNFFLKKRLGKKIPLVRNEWTLEELGFRDQMLEIAKENRKDKPWYVQN